MRVVVVRSVVAVCVLLSPFALQLGVLLRFSNIVVSHSVAGGNYSACAVQPVLLCSSFVVDVSTVLYSTLTVLFVSTSLSTVFASWNMFV